MGGGRRRSPGFLGRRSCGCSGGVVLKEVVLWREL